MSDILEYTVKKTVVDCYRLRHESGMYWADIIVDANGEKGRVQIASDFGDYQYYWGACGISFKQFLINLSMDYVSCKFNADRWFDADATIKAYRKEVTKSDLTKEKLTVILDEINELESNAYHKDEFIYYLSAQCDNLMKFYDHQPEFIYDITPQFKQFWKNVWPVFCAELKKETEEAAMYDF